MREEPIGSGNALWKCMLYWTKMRAKFEKFLLYPAAELALQHVETDDTPHIVPEAEIT